MLFLTLCLATGCQSGCAGWNQAFERMVNQPKEKPFGASDFYPGGEAMQPPPEGTIPTTAVIGQTRLTGGRESDGTYVKDFPLPLTTAMVERGRDRFDIYCAPCHGLLGTANTPVARKMQLRQPPSLHVPTIRALNPGQLYEVIRAGYGFMPSYASELTIDDRWAVAAYVKALQISRGVPIVSLPTPVRVRAEQALR